eukprot:6500356-Pyramimonas_sp.AAC.1
MSELSPARQERMVNSVTANARRTSEAVPLPGQPGSVFDLRLQGRLQGEGQSQQGRNARRLATKAHRPTPQCTCEGQNAPH